MVYQTSPTPCQGVPAKYTEVSYVSTLLCLYIRKPKERDYLSYESYIAVYVSEEYRADLEERRLK